MGSKSGFAVPYFHSVQPEPDKEWMKSYLSLRLEVFEQFLIYLKRHKWQTLFLDEMHDLQTSGKTGTEKYCVLTFDDGYADNYIYAYPLLQKYGMKGTVFVSPECIDARRSKAKNLLDVRNGRAELSQLPLTAYLTWEEMKEMQNSGVMDIQSHTMTHTKYFCSDQIVAFHHRGDDCVYQVSNLYPELRPYYFKHPGFAELLPWGTPFFEQKSAVTARIHKINPAFEEEVISEISRKADPELYDFTAWMQVISSIYKAYREKNAVIEQIETDEEYDKRVRYEITESKRILEEGLGKPVHFLCWPHGDNNAALHTIAMEAGYKATTVGKSGADPDRTDRFDRVGIAFRRNFFFSKIKWNLALNSAAGRSPARQIRKLVSVLS